MISAQTRSAFVARETASHPASSAGQAFPDHATAFLRAGHAALTTLAFNTAAGNC
jgi:hypothetical protein